MRKGKIERAFGDLRKQCRLLRICAAAGDQPRTDYDGGKIRLGHQPAPERLHQNPDFNGSPAEAAVLFGNRQRQPAEVGELLPDRRTEAVGLGRSLAPVVGGISSTDKTVGAFAQQALLVAEGEVHLSTSLWRVFARKDAGPKDPPPFRIPAGYARGRADAAQRPVRPPQAVPSRRPSG